jgi:hypothetical protein
MASMDSDTVRNLMKLIFLAHQEIEILHQILGEATSLPQSRRDDIRRLKIAQFQPLFSQLEASSDEQLQQILARYKGPLEA